VTSALAAAKLEKELYPPITQLLQQRGWRVWEQATIRAGDEGTRTADHVAWRWEGDEIDTLAVEVKPGRADIGLAQAVAYSTGFDRVFVAAEEPFVSAGYLASVFVRLGLGYICVTPSDAVIEHEAERSPFIADAIRTENIARVRLRHLFVEDALGEPVRFDVDSRGDNWAVTGTMSEWQLCGQVVTGTAATYVSLLAESKRVGDAAAQRLDSAFFAEALASIGASTELILQERRHDGHRPLYSGVLRRWSPADDQEALEELLAFARTLSGPRVGPQFEIRTVLWADDGSLAESAARRDLEETVTQLRGVQTLLNKGL